MRSDMFKVIVERPRWAASHAPSPKLKRTKDQTLKRIGLKRHVFEDARYAKALSENLAPLVRFFRSRTGHPWNDVFSEICESLDMGSTVKVHVRNHIEDVVLTRISVGRLGEWMFEGQVLGCESTYFWKRPFFVDPDDGILRDSAFLAARLPEANRIIAGERA